MNFARITPACILAAPLAAMLCAPARAELVSADSPAFAVNTQSSTAVPGHGDSAAFLVDTTRTSILPSFGDAAATPVDCTRINRAWGDSEAFEIVDSQNGPILNSATPQCDGITPGIFLSWTAVQAATNYEIHRNNVLVFTTQTAGTTFWNVTGLSAGQSYSYRVRARFGPVAGGFSNAVVATAPICVTPPPENQPQLDQHVPPITVTLDHLWQWNEALDRFDDANLVEIDPNAPTYILAHGWEGDLNGNDDGNNPCPSPGYTLRSIGCAIRQSFDAADQSVNLLAWDWRDAANPNGECDTDPGLLTQQLFQVLSVSPSAAMIFAHSVLDDARKAGLSSADEGYKLGKALANQLAGPNGTLGSELHFIGFSHGGGVVGRAAEVMNQRGYPPDSITTLDTPKVGCVGQGCFVNSLQFVKPNTVKPGGQIAVFHYKDAFWGFGRPIEGCYSNLTNIHLNRELIHGIAHFWIRGPGETCLGQNGWFNVGVWDPTISSPRTLVFNNTIVAASPLSVLGFPDGRYEEETPFGHLTGGDDPACPHGDLSEESETPGLALLAHEAFESASSWFGTNAALFIGADPIDAINSAILMIEQDDASFFKDIDWPTKALEITFDYMFRDPRGEESLTVYLGNEILYYDSADVSLAVGQLKSSGAIAIAQAAGSTTRLTFVLRTDGTAGGSLILDNLRTWGIQSGDISGDAILNGLDIQPFVAAVLANSTDPAHLYVADFNGNASIDVGDIAGFVSVLIEP